MLKLDITQRLDFDPTSVSESLSPGTQSDRYRLFEVVYEDELGIVYRALDLKLQCQVAVKEYFPRLIASRTDSGGVEARGAAIVKSFEAGVRDFAEEARALRALQVRSIVRVLRVWLANGTAYRAMPWIAGAALASRLLAQQVAQGPASPLSPSTLDSVLEPLLESVRAIHQRGRLHGRLSPSNVYLSAESGIVLFGFRAKLPSVDEASWREADAAADACRAIELTPSKATALDAYVPGPWSDLYSIGALMHLMVVGRLPTPACQRSIDDDYEPLAEQTIPHHDPHLLHVIDWALTLRPDKRPRDIAQFKRRLQSDEPANAARARDLSTFVPAAPELQARGGAASKPVRISLLARSDSNDFVATRPMVYGDHHRKAQDAVAAPTAPAAPRHVIPPMARPAARSAALRDRKIIALIIVFVLVAGLAALAWWSLDPWIRPTLGSSDLPMHAPVAASLSSSTESGPGSDGYSAPIDMGASKVSTSATLVDRAAPVPASTPASRHHRNGARRIRRSPSPAPTLPG